MQNKNKNINHLSPFSFLLFPTFAESRLVFMAEWWWDLQIEKFDKWNDQKKELHKKNSKLCFKEWKIWWCSLWMNVWVESIGKWDTFRRPVLVIKKLSQDSAVVIPLTTKKKDWTWYTEISVHGENRWALLSQIRLLSTKRLQRRLAVLDDNDFNKIKKELKKLLKL